MPDTGDFRFLWELMGELNIGLQLVGKADDSGIDSIIEVQNIGYVDHPEAIEYMKNARVLLLLIRNTPFNKCITTGKIFEYLAARRPILGIGPENGEAAQILRETGRGIMIDYSDREKIKEYLLSFKNWME